MKKNLSFTITAILTFMVLGVPGQNNLNIVVQQGHSLPVNSCASTPDGKLIVTGGNGGAIKLWNDNGILICNFPLPFTSGYFDLSTTVWEVEISPEGDLVFAKVDRDWHTWKIDGTYIGKRDQLYPTEISRKVKGYDIKYDALAWGKYAMDNIWELPNRRYLVSYTRGRILSLCNKNGEQIATLGNNISKIENVMFSNYLKQVHYIYSNEPDGRVNQVFATQSYNNIRDFSFSRVDFSDLKSKDLVDANITFSVNQKENLSESDPLYAIVVNGNTDKKIYINKNGQEIKRVEGKDLTHQIWISPDGSYTLEDDMENVAIIGPNDKTIKKYEAGLTFHIADEPYFSFSKDGSRFLTYRKNGLFVFDKTGKRLAKFEAGNWVEKLPNNQQLTFNLSNAILQPDGNGIFLVCFNKTYRFRVVDLDGKLKDEFEVPSELVDNKKASFLENSSPFTYGKYSPDGSFIAGINYAKDIVLITPKGQIIKWLKGHTSEIKSFDISKDGKHLVSTAWDNTIRIWNIETGDHAILLQNNSDWILYTPDGYYDCSSNGGKLVSVVNGSEFFAIDQFAAKYNRPDIILKRIGLGTDDLITHYNNQYKKRLRKLGLTEEQLANDLHVPVASIVSTEVKDKYVALKADLKDDLFNLKQYNVFVNDVPLYGSYGKPITGMSYSIEENIELTTGTNKIEISCINEKGTESYRTLTYAECKNQQKNNLYLLAFGVSKYNDSKLNLQFADKDATDLSKVIETYKGKGFDNVYTKVLTNEQVTPDAIKASKDFVKNAKPDDTFILFIAGHGMHDKDAEATYYYLTSNADINNLKGTAADFETIEDLLQGIPPRNKLFLMDACESGEIDEEDQGQMIAAATGVGIASRGFKTASSPSTVNTQPTTKRSYLYQKDRYIYNDLVRRSGAIVFSSSKGGELSYERSDIENGLFTEYIMKALTTTEADKDGNGTVSTDELREYVSSQVAKASGDLQHPTVDRDNIYQKFGFGLE